MTRKFLLASVLLLGLAVSSAGQTAEGPEGETRKVTVTSWTQTPMDGSRTGVTSPSIDNVRESLGYFKGGKYYAPNGRVYGRHSATARTAREIIAVQSEMATVKKVVGYSTRTMTARPPQSDLSNWFIDNIMESVEKLSGKKVSFGVGNFGGIRCSMPAGDIILDDLMSMFPFKNQVVYLELPGSEIRKLLEDMAQGHFQVLGGCEVVVKDRKLQSALLDGKPIEDDRWYGVATISFLLDGGDRLYLRNGSRNLQIYDVDIIDIILDKVASLTAEGKPIEYQTDNRIIILDWEDRKR